LNQIREGNQRKRKEDGKQRGPKWKGMGKGIYKIRNKVSLGERGIPPGAVLGSWGGRIAFASSSREG